MSVENKILLAAGAGLLAVLLIPKLAGLLTKGAVVAAGSAASGVVTGAAGAVGIPETGRDKCINDLMTGSAWASSFDCPAPVFAYSLFNDRNASVDYANTYENY